MKCRIEWCAASNDDGTLWFCWGQWYVEDERCNACEAVKLQTLINEDLFVGSGVFVRLRWNLFKSKTVLDDFKKTKLGVQISNTVQTRMNAIQKKRGRTTATNLWAAYALRSVWVTSQCVLTPQLFLLAVLRTVTLCMYRARYSYAAHHTGWPFQRKLVTRGKISHFVSGTGTSSEQDVIYKCVPSNVWTLY